MRRCNSSCFLFLNCNNSLFALHRDVIPIDSGTDIEASGDEESRWVN
jgi:hypothetical protein